MEEKKILNQHSALITHNIKKGKYYKLNVEKSIFTLLLRTQQDLKQKFKELYNQETKDIIKKNISQNFLDNIFTGKELEIENNEVNNEKLIKKIEEINIKKIERIDKITPDLLEREKLKKEITKTKDLTLTNINKMFFEIKDFCKEEAIKEQLDTKIINFTTLANAINCHSTSLKKDMIAGMDTVLEYNYINKKKLNVDVVTSLLASVKFTQSKQTTWLEYQIPKEILELLLMPDVYVPLEGVVVGKLSGTYTIRMYSLLKDHLKRGEIELTKEEIFNFFSLPTSYSNKTNFLLKFLKPTLEEVENASGIRTEYEFIPAHNYQSIKFFPKKIKNFINNTIPVIEKNDNIILIESDEIQKYTLRAKQNFYVNKTWNKNVENKLKKIHLENGEEVLIYILKALYTDLKIDIKVSLTKYIEGILKKYYSNNIEIEKKKSIIEYGKEQKKDIDSLINSITQDNLKIEQGKTIVNFKVYNEKIKELISNGLTKKAAEKFLSIRYIVEEDEVEKDSNCK